MLQKITDDASVGNLVRYQDINEKRTDNKLISA